MDNDDIIARGGGDYTKTTHPDNDDYLNRKPVETTEYKVTVDWECLVEANTEQEARDKAHDILYNNYDIEDIPLNLEIHEE